MPAQGVGKGPTFGHTQSLWIQDALREKRLGINKVPGTENPSDAMTKFLDGTTLMKTLNMMKCHFLEGRPESAPQLAEDAAGVDHLSIPECLHPQRPAATAAQKHQQLAATAAQKPQQHAASAAAVGSGSTASHLFFGGGRACLVGCRYAT